MKSKGSSFWLSMAMIKNMNGPKSKLWLKFSNFLLNRKDSHKKSSHLLSFYRFKEDKQGDKMFHSKEN